MWTVRAAMTALALGLTTSAARADVAGRYETTEEKPFIDMEMTLETDDGGDVRMQMAGQSSYYLLTGGELFVVSLGQTGPTVVRVEDLLTVQAEALERMGVTDRFTPDPADTPRMEFVELGPETAGAWSGTAYGFRSSSAEGFGRPLLVLSNDPL